MADLPAPDSGEPAMRRGTRPRRPDAPPTETATRAARAASGDKFYTSPAVAARCLALFRAHVDVGPDDLVIEPGAGAGAFVPGIAAFARHSRFYDIAPEGPEIEAQDYLALDTAPLKAAHARIHVVGNPPFGRQASLATRFIRKSAGFCDSIGFVLPRSFKKASMQRAFPPDFWLLCEEELPADAFTVGGAPHRVPCVFQVWTRRAAPREPAPRLEPRTFAWALADEANIDAAVRRVGGRAGEVFWGGAAAGRCAASHYFLRFTNGLDEAANRQRLAGAAFARDNTVGPRSISKQELIAQFDV